MNILNEQGLSEEQRLKVVKPYVHNTQQAAKFEDASAAFDAFTERNKDELGLLVEKLNKVHD